MRVWRPRSTGFRVLGAAMVSFGLVVGARVAVAQAPAADVDEGRERARQGAGGPAWKLPALRERLDNGLRVVMSVDHGAPTVAVVVTYGAGAADEPLGRGGVARLVEGLMAEGSPALSAGGRGRLVAARGGRTSTLRSPDLTAHGVELPSGELGFALWLEAERMRAIEVDENALARERRTALAEVLAPGGFGGRGGRDGEEALASALDALVFQGHWPYAHGRQGTAEALGRVEVGWAKEQLALYGPERAVLSVVGDFEPAKAMDLVRRYFGAIAARGNAAGELPPRKEALAAQEGPRRGGLHGRGVGTPGVVFGWATPSAQHADGLVLEVTAAVLGGGEGSRLHRLLVVERGVALEVRADVARRRGPGLFSLRVRLSGKAKPGDVEKLVEGEIASLAARGPSEVELTRARAWAAGSRLVGMQSSGARAMRLGEAEQLLGDAALLEGEPARLQAVRGDEVQRVTREHLGASRRSGLEVRSVAGEEGP
ncbi:M16 family metallopeptidase [Chondromyces crocatus]|uniref:M16 family metallopeptidase n=1 Tax=Chondromyces crocatus TaxID=52 RepID=UPI0012E26A11|nr:pitrilysin family protein [Chondromyces crocatus]